MSAFVKIAEDTAGFTYRSAKKALLPKPLPLPTIDPLPKTVMARERADGDRLRKKRRRATVMGGRGELTLGRPGLLGV